MEFDVSVDVRSKTGKCLRTRYLCEIIRMSRDVHRSAMLCTVHLQHEPATQDQDGGGRCGRRRRGGRRDRAMVALLDGTFWASEAAFLRGTEPDIKCAPSSGSPPRVVFIPPLSPLPVVPPPRPSPSPFPTSSTTSCAPYAPQHRLRSTTGTSCVHASDSTRPWTSAPQSYFLGTWMTQHDLVQGARKKALCSIRRSGL